MAALIVELCDAVVAHLNDRTTNSFSFTFTAIRSNPAFVRLEETNLTRVFVYPVQLSKRIVDRRRFDRMYRVNVHVTNYLDTDEIDDALQLVEEIEDAMESVEAAGFQMITFDSELGGRAPYEVQNISDARYFHVPIGIDFLKIDA